MMDPNSIARPKVSVALITYNQADFIAQAIESVLIQETDFDFELVIGEDDSSDGTREIVKSYKQKFPSKIKLLLNDRSNVIFINQQPTGRWNLINTLHNCSGEYIALLEGDDYWINPTKLQQQVDLLDKNPKFSICFHSVNYLNEADEGSSTIFSPPGKKEEYILAELLQLNFISTLSVLFRNGLFQQFPDWFYRIPVGDYPLCILCAENGRIGFINEVMGTHRIHEGGYWQSKGSERRILDWLQVNEIINDYLKNSKYLKYAQSSLFYSKYRIELYNRNIIQALKYLYKCLCLVPGHLAFYNEGMLKNISRILLSPRSYGKLKGMKNRLI